MAVVAVVVVLTRDGRHEVEPGRVERARASPAEASAALASFVAGLESRDGEALVAIAPPGDAAAEELLAGVADNARSLDLRAVAARFVDQVGIVDPDGSWSGTAEVAWQIGGLDDAPSTTDVVVRFAPDADGLGIAGFEVSDPGRGRLPLWLRGRLAVARSGDVLAMVDGDQARADAVAARARRGVAVVERVLPTGPVVVEVPGTASELDESLGAEPGTYAAIAAVTTTAGSTTDDDAPVHVFVNPDVTARLGRAGAQVVMSHEIVHVATDAARRPVEPWLLEGFADYVALRGTTLPETTTLGRAIRVARRDGVPDALPSAADLDTRADDLQARYEEAWLACRIVAERLGEQGLLDLYAAAGDEPVGRALRQAGLPLAELTSAWRERLGALSGT